jgi:hypothetical protein
VAGKNILLIEPGYKNKYPPLGLMKIAQYHGPYGKHDNVRFIKGEDKSVLSTMWDRIYVTTLFSFEWKKTAEAIDFALRASHNQPGKIFVGGIAASLMPEAFLAESRWRGIRFIKGLLKEPPAVSLQLDRFSEELYSDDLASTPIEDHVPDYDILNQVAYKYPVHDAYFAYASRGCVRKCSFCGVPKLEGGQRDTESIVAVVEGIEKLYGPKKDLILMDNNVVASHRFKEIIAQIRDLGFTSGAKLRRGRVPVKRRVDFNQGVDARILCKDPMYLRELSTICIKPLRIAFDHLGVRKPYETAIRYAAEVGLRDLSNYMLYNFKDTPADLYQRMRLNIDLNEQLGIRIFSFPMRYQPVTLKDRSHIGDHWNRYYLRSMQMILQATHGIVSGSPTFFKRAFGDDEQTFESLLSRPHHFTFNRVWYEDLDGRGEFDEYPVEMKKLSDSEKAELLMVLSTHEKSEYTKARKMLSNEKLRKIMRYYIPPSLAEERKIWEKQKDRLKAFASEQPEVPDDERVEDAGLEIAA